jgi:plasmid stability protein
MTTITVKNIPDELYEALKRSASLNRRSLNSEIIVCLERSLGSYRIDPEEMRETARRLRQKTAHYVISAEELQAAKEEGRQ